MPRPSKDAPKGVGSLNPRAADLWPGITTGFDARCTCTWAHMQGVYQVKVRDALCLTHGGPLAGALSRVTPR